MFHVGTRQTGKTRALILEAANVDGVLVGFSEDHIKALKYHVDLLGLLELRTINMKDLYDSVVMKSYYDSGYLSPDDMFFIDDVYTCIKNSVCLGNINIMGMTVDPIEGVPLELREPENKKDYEVANEKAHVHRELYKIIKRSIR